MACIELADGEAATLEAAQRIFEAAGESLTYFKLPGCIAFVPALPLITSQKLQRGELKVLSRKLVEQGVAFDLRHLKKAHFDALKSGRERSPRSARRCG